LKRTNQLTTIAEWAREMQEAMKLSCPIFECARIGLEYNNKMRDAVEMDREL